MKDKDSQRKYTIGLDFGTLSARALLVDVTDGTEVMTAVRPYSHGVITECLPETNVPLKEGTALQDPRDYREALTGLLRETVNSGGIAPGQIIGIAVDATATTLIPVDADYVPLCMHEKYRKNPHSWPKLWKHHGACRDASLFNKIAHSRHEEFLERCGGDVSAEWMFPKIQEILREAEEIYAAAYRFMELSDWLVYLLTKKESRNSIVASVHAQWSVKKGFPAKEFFETIDPALRDVVEEKIGKNVMAAYEKAGNLHCETARLTGLHTAAVAAGNSDGAIAMPGLGIVQEGIGALILGTSSVLMFMTREELQIPGAMCTAENLFLPGLWGHMLGQSAVGDCFSWFMENILPHKYLVEAGEKGVSPYGLMDEKISMLRPGETGLIALDWFNGNRSVLKDTELSGLILGLKLSTKPEHIYRALIEAAAFGMCKIIHTVRLYGAQIQELRVCGGAYTKSPAIMQIWTDILGMDIRVAESGQTAAFGAAVTAAAAAGEDVGGYKDIKTAVKKMYHDDCRLYRPIPENQRVYEELYREYVKLHDYFGKENRMMHKLSDWE